MGTHKEVHTLKLVHIRYLDITQQEEDNLEMLNGCVEVSEWGLLIKIEPNQIHIIKTYNHTNNKGYAHEVCSIPIGCVIDMEIIKEYNTTTHDTTN